MPVTSEQLVEALRPVEDPELHRSIVDLGMVRRAEWRPDGTVSVLVALTVPGCPLRNEIQSRVDSALRPLEGVSAVELEFTVMSDREREELRVRLQGNGHAHAHGQPQGHAAGRPVPFNQPGSKTRPLLISSGKGGVGKSSVTANLAAALAADGKQVGVLDADVWGYSQPRMLGLGAERPRVNAQRKLIPLSAHDGISVMSIGFFIEQDAAVVWRGPMLHKALQQFLEDVDWGELDYLLIDLPPGTGDVSMTLAQLLPQAKFLIVTTPQPVAQKVARRSAEPPFVVKALAPTHNGGQKPLVAF